MFFVSFWQDPIRGASSVAKTLSNTDIEGIILTLSALISDEEKKISLNFYFPHFKEVWSVKMCEEVWIKLQRLLDHVAILSFLIVFMEQILDRFRKDDANV